MTEAARERLVDQRPVTVVSGKGCRAAVHELPERQFLAGLFPDPGMLDGDHGRRSGGPGAALAVAKGYLPHPQAAVTPAGLEHPHPILGQPGREHVPELAGTPVQVSVSAPAETAGRVQDFLGAYQRDHVRVRPDPRPGRCGLPQQRIEHHPVTVRTDRIHPAEHAIGRQQPVTDLICAGQAVPNRLDSQAQPGQRGEHRRQSRTRHRRLTVDKLTRKDNRHPPGHGAHASPRPCLTLARRVACTQEEDHLIEVLRIGS